jgi:hypothetical protein
LGVFSKGISGRLKYLVNVIFIPFPFSFFLSFLLSGYMGRRRKASGCRVWAADTRLLSTINLLPYRWLWEITGHELGARQLLACAPSLHNFARAPAQ